MIKQIIMMMFR